MATRLQLGATVAGLAVVAALAVVGVTLATRDDPPKLHPQPGKPPVPASVPGPGGADIRRAFQDWPHGSLTTLERIANQQPESAVVQLYLGVGLLWAGYGGDAQTTLERAKKLGRDTPWAVAADNLLHPQYFSGYPIFKPLRPNRLLAEGSRLQSEGRQQSAERLYEKAARLAPDDPEAQVAAAVGRFDKDDLSASFSQLGPLSKRFPRSQVVRFYLGWLLAWTGQRDQAIVEMKKAEQLGPTTELGRNAKAFLRGVRAGGTGGSGK